MQSKIFKLIGAFFFLALFSIIGNSYGLPTLPVQIVKLIDGTETNFIGSINDSVKAYITNSDLLVHFHDHSQDAFGKLRVSNPITLAEYSHLTDKDPIHWDEAITGTATSTWTSTNVSVEMDTGTTLGNKVVRQTYRYHPYFKGKSQLFYITGKSHGQQTNVRKRYGAFDDNNGVFYESDGSQFCVVIRSSTTGSPIDQRFCQGNWNIDNMDGSGPSGFTLDITKQNLYAISYSWLGSGGVRFGVVLDGEVRFLHFYEAGNNTTDPWSRSGNYPLRAEIENIGTAPVAGNMHITCQTVVSEGGNAAQGTVYNMNTGITPLSVSTTPSIIGSIRINPSYQYTSIRPLRFTLKAESGNTTLFWQVIYRPSIVGGAWVNHAGIAQTLSSYTSFSGGYVVGSGYIDLSNKATFSNIIQVQGDINLGFDIAGNPEAYILVGQTLSSTGTVLFEGDFREFK